MLYILLGHLLGFITIGLVGPLPVEDKLQTYIVLLFLLLFLESQVIRSVMSGKFYFRGTITSDQTSIFKQGQFCYSFLACFILMGLIQSL